MERVESRGLNHVSVCGEHKLANPVVHIWYTHMMTMANKILSQWTALLRWLRRYGHHVSLVTCLVGFALDSTFLPSIDHPITRMISALYFSTATISILVVQGVASNKIRIPWVVALAPIFSLITQFIFGGLLSIVFVYYFRSAEIFVSWPIVILLGSLMAGNELWRKRHAQLEFQVTVLFILFLFFSIFVVPLVVGAMGTKIFLLSVLVSIVMLGILLVLLSSVAWGVLRERALKLFIMLSSSALLVVGLYFINLLPPIPLVVRADGVYHSLLRDTSGEYVGGKEEETWKQRYLSLLYPPEYHRLPGEPIYFYSAVYAPTQLHTPIVHLWQYWDESESEWVTSSRIGFTMSGGRAAGYRGYSEKEYAPAGTWRVLVETGDGRTISRKKFTIVDTVTSANVTKTAI